MEYDRETGEVIEPERLPAVETLRREMNLIFSSPQCGQVFGALCSMQGTMESPKRTKKAKVKGRTRTGNEYEYEYNYAPLEEIISTVKQPMAAAKLAYRQFLAVRDRQWVMRTVIGHSESGEWFGCDYPVFWDESRGMQGFASGVTYARRYGLMLALGIAAEDDDDANVADGRPATIAGRSEARTAQGSNSGGQSAPRGQQADPAPSEAKVEAAKRYKELRAAIDEAQTALDLDGWTKAPAWETCRAKIEECDGPETAAQAMQQLLDRIESRKAMLRGNRGDYGR